jgi:type IV pilus assembly protein PilB
MARVNLGQILMNMGAIDAMQLQAALAHHRQWGTPLGQSLVQNRLCSEEVVMTALAKQTGLPLIDLDAHELDLSLAPILSRKVAEQHRVVPLRLEGRRQETLVVAIAAPAGLGALDAVRSVSKKRVVAQLASDAAIDKALGKLYRGYATAETVRVAARNAPIVMEEEQFELDPASEPAARPVMIYGWTESAGRNLALILSAEGISARVVGAMEVLSCLEDDVLIAPLPAVEALLPQGQRFRGRLIVAGKRPEEDLPRAQRIGARGFIAAPLDTELLLRAVRRCQRPEHPPAPQAAA